jgi:hypothetical protein
MKEPRAWPLYRVILPHSLVVASNAEHMNVAPD